MKGRVTWWNNSTNCGFIEVNDEEFFVHSDNNDISVRDDELIEFSIQKRYEGLFICNVKEIK